MKTDRIFIGTIKECLSIYRYEKYGDTVTPNDLRIFNIKYAVEQTNVKIVKANAILIKVRDNEYVTLDSIDSKLKEKQIESGIFLNTIKSVPSKDGELFVDEKSLTPYFEDTKRDNIKIKSLKK